MATKQTKPTPSKADGKPAVELPLEHSDEEAIAQEASPPSEVAQEEQAPDMAEGELDNDSPLTPDDDLAPTVECAVLHDSVYGKHDEIITLPEDQAVAVAAAGYVDMHPNAIKAIRSQS